MFIELTYKNYSRSNGRKFQLRADLIERISEGYDNARAVTLQNGNYYSVKESATTIRQLTMQALGVTNLL